MHRGRHTAASYCDKRLLDIDLAIKRVGEAIKGEPGVRPAPRRYPVEEQGMTYLGDTAATAPR